MSLLAGLAESFATGVATPLTAVCALPLYPGFLAYLSNQQDSDYPVAALGGLVVLGVVTFMFLVGIVFTRLLEASLTSVVAVVSPVAFAILTVVGVVLLLDLHVFDRLPTVDPPQSRYPTLSAFSYGFFFGGIVLPCNPGFIALFFARVPVLYDTQLESLLGFLAFGLGIGAPLLAFAIVSQSRSRAVTRWFARHSGPINRVTGAVMVAVSVYYLVYVFRVPQAAAGAVGL